MANVAPCLRALAMRDPPDGTAKGTDGEKSLARC